jgi:hypothetical protein
MWVKSLIVITVTRPRPRCDIPPRSTSNFVSEVITVLVARLNG